MFPYLSTSTFLTTYLSVDSLLQDRKEWFKFLWQLDYYKLYENWQLEEDPNKHLWCEGRQKCRIYGLWLESATWPWNMYLARRVATGQASGRCHEKMENLGLFILEEWEKKNLQAMEFNNSTAHKMTCFCCVYLCPW